MPDAEPMIIDDGGSTRIKQAKDDVNMDSLLQAPHQGPVNGQFPNNAGTGSIVAKCNVNVLSVDKDGAATTSGPFSFGANETAVVTSDLGQTLTLDLDRFGVLTVKLEAGGGSEPIVEARQHGARRRYIVTNAGPIKNVKVKNVLKFTAPPDAIYNLIRLTV